MLKQTGEAEFQYNEKPRKRIKLNVREDDNYNEFKGEYQDIEIIPQAYQPNAQQDSRQVNFNTYEQQKQRDNGIFDFIKKSGRKIRSIKDASKNQTEVIDVKTENIVATNVQKLKGKVEQSISESDPQKRGRNSIAKIKRQEPISKPNSNKRFKPTKPETNGMNNWSKFLSQASKVEKPVKKNTVQTTRTENVGMDCQFVRSGEEELLGRVSIVSQSGTCLLDTYVHPQKKITDYVSDISGITYAHIKNAPSTKEVLERIKKVLYSRIIVGHTIWKDLEVCGLKEWRGWKAVIDINEYEAYQEKSGKLISLKNLSARHLGRQIQQGRHSSLEDAEVTIALFLLKKKEILKHFKVIL